MSLEEYQRKAMTTCMESSNNFCYMMLNLVGEVGEFSSKVAKAIRKRKAIVEWNHLITEDEVAMTEDELDDLKKEAGDILWQLSGLCTVMGWKLEDVAQENLAKLSDRKDRNVIAGNGDNR